MNIGQLSRATAQILADYLPSILGKEQVPEETDPARKTAKTIWERLYPAVTDNQSIREATAQLSHSPTEENRERMARRLEVLFLKDTLLASGIQALIAASPYASLMEESERPAPLHTPAGELLHPLEAPPPAARPAPTAPVFADLPSACSICGRQDETVRAVSYPYVVSVIVMTYRRQFAGVWCRWHAALRWVAAMLVTVTVGWFGIPFGFIFTPVALFTLAKGGGRLDDANARLLREIARLKLGQNEPETAARCLEASLRFEQREDTEMQLEQLYREHGMPTTPGAIGQMMLLAGVTLGAWLIGLVIGILDWLYVGVTESILSGDSIFVAILSWTPLVAMAYVGGLLISRLIARVLEASHVHRRLLAISLAVVAMALAAYGIPTGLMLGAEVSQSLFGAAPGSVPNILAWIGNILIYRGLDWLYIVATSGATSDLIYTIVMIVICIFYLWLGISTANEAASWQRRLLAIRQRASSEWKGALLVGCLAIVAILVVGACLAILVAVALYLSPAQPYADSAMALFEQGDLDGATRELEEGIRVDPDYYLLHLELGGVYYQQNRCEEALDEVEVAASLVPGGEEQAVTLYVMGNTYDCLGDSDSAVEAYQQAIAVVPDEPAYHLALGMTRLFRGDFQDALDHLETAAALSPESVEPHAYMALAYYQLDETEAMDAALAQALARTAQTPRDFYALATFYSYQRDFAAAEQHLLEADALMPETPGILLRLAYNYSYQQELEAAHDAIDQVFALDEDNAGAYVARAEVYFQERDLESAQAELEQALALNPDEMDLHADLSFIHYQQGELDLALAEAEEAVSQWPYRPYGHVQLAFAYLANDRLDDALEAAQEALRIRPQHDVAHYVMGLCYREMGEDDLAAAEFETFLSLTWDRAYVDEYQADAEAFLAGRTP